MTITADGTAVYPWNHGETLTAAALNAAIANASVASAANVANVIDFGADPTGGTDSSPAFNAAAATLNAHGQNNSVYVPSGNYRINNQISLVNAQSLFGDGRGNTRLFCDGNFNMAASSVIMLQPTTQFLDPGPEIRGITISMIQNMSATSRGQLIQYPPVISCQAQCGRFKVLHCRIEGAWNGITTNGTNTPFSIWDLELGALNEGLQIGLGATGPQDFCHIHGLHFWPFACPQTVFADGNTVALHVGRADGLDCTDFSALTSQVIVDSANSSTTIIHFTNLKLDADQSALTINGGNHIHIANFYASALTARTKPAITVNSNATVHITNWYSHSTSAVADINVIAGWLAIENAHIAHYNQASPVATTQGILKISDMTVWASTAGAYSQALIQQSGAVSNLVVDGLKVENLGNASTGTAINIGSDNVGNSIGIVTLPSGWTVNLPGTMTHTQPAFPAGLTVQMPGGPGYLALSPSGGAQPGYVAYYNNSGQRVGFAGYSDGATHLQLESENGFTGWQATGDFTATSHTVGSVSGPNIRAGTGAATGTQPAGSLWLRTDGAAGSRLYVSAGGGTWNAVAGV